MASKKVFKPPVKKLSKFIQINNDHSKSPKLSTSKYAAISDAVIHFKGNRSPTQVGSIIRKSSEPKGSASLKNSQSDKADSTAQLKINPDKNYSTKTSSKVSVHKKSSNVKTMNTTYDSESEPTIYTEEVKKSSLRKTKRFKFKTSKTFRAALNVMKKDPQFFSKLSKFGLSRSPAIQPNKLSQPPKHLSHRERLEWLQARRGIGLWIQCDNCKKWRWSNVDDPVDVPKNWICAINPDTKYNQCKIPEPSVPMYIQNDLIHNKFTAGSIVWAKMYGYPWWPAMVDDCPDTEQYYWLDKHLYIPTFYHVVFFDCKQNEITRSWIPVRCIVSFKHHPNLDRKFTVQLAFQHRVTCGKQQAARALQLNVKQRLAQYSFLARWTKEIVTPPPSDSELDEKYASNEVTKSTKKKNSKDNHKDNKPKDSHVASGNERDLVMKYAMKLEVSIMDKRQKQMQGNDGVDENETSKKTQADLKENYRETKKEKHTEKRSKSADSQLKNNHSFEKRKFEEKLENIKPKEKKTKRTNEKSEKNEQSLEYDKEFDKRSSHRDKDRDKLKNQISKHSKLEMIKAKSEFAKRNQTQSKVEKAPDTIVESYFKPKSSFDKGKFQSSKENVLNKWKDLICVETTQMSSKDSANRASVKTQKVVHNAGQREDIRRQEPVIIDDSSDDEKIA